MVDYGPDPDRSASGSFAPGASTGLTFPAVGSSSGHESWPGLAQTSLMVAAKLGTLGIGASTDVIRWDDVNPSETRFVKFWATRSSGVGSSVTLRFNVGSTGSGSFLPGVTVPWNGPDFEYAWAWRNGGVFTNDSFLAPASDVLATNLCEPVATQGIDTSNEINYTTYILSNAVGIVAATAPSDLRVTYVAQWFNLASPQSPTIAQFGDRLGVFTCPTGGWLVGAVGIG